MSKIRLTLTLLVARIFADDADNSLAADDAAGFTKGLNRWANSHGYEEEISTAFRRRREGSQLECHRFLTWQDHFQTFFTLFHDRSDSVLSSDSAALVVAKAGGRSLIH